MVSAAACRGRVLSAQHSTSPNSLAKWKVRAQVALPVRAATRDGGVVRVPGKRAVCRPSGFLGKSNSPRNLKNEKPVGGQTGCLHDFVDVAAYAPTCLPQPVTTAAATPG